MVIRGKSKIVTLETLQIQYLKPSSVQLTANKKGFSGKNALVGGLLKDGLGLFAGTIGSSKLINSFLKISIFFLLFSFLFVFELNAQVNIQISAGLIKDKNLATTIPRATIGVNNLYTFSLKKISKEALAVLCNGEQISMFELGMYYTYEYKNGIYFQEDKTNYYTRDILGLKLKFPNNLYINSGVGFFQKGILTTNRENHLRKEFGVGYQFSDLHLTIDGSFSNIVGSSVNIGYVIPIGQFSQN